MSTIYFDTDTYEQGPGVDGLKENPGHDFHRTNRISVDEKITITARRGGIVSRQGYHPVPSVTLDAIPVGPDPSPGSEPEWYLDGNGMARVFGTVRAEFTCFPDPDGLYPRPGSPSEGYREASISKFEHVGTDSGRVTTSQSGIYIGSGDTTTGVVLVSNSGGTVVLTQTFYYHNYAETPEVDYVETWTWTFSNERPLSEFLTAAREAYDAADWVSSYPWTKLDDGTFEQAGVGVGTLQDLSGFVSPIAGVGAPETHCQFNGIKFRVFARDWFERVKTYGVDWTELSSTDSTLPATYDYDTVHTWEPDGEARNTHEPLLTNP